MKYKPHHRTDVKTREAYPKVVKTNKGIEIRCPFCNPSHVILPGVESRCGTTLRVTAVQLVLQPHTTRHKKLVCLKCGETGGEMVQCGDGFVHITDCQPGTKVLSEIPPLSRWAKLVYRMPAFLRSFVEKRTGAAKEIRQVDPSGKETGQIVGYIFAKKVEHVANPR